MESYFVQIPSVPLEVTFDKSIVVVVQEPSGVRLFATPWTAARQASLTIPWTLPKFMSTELVSTELVYTAPKFQLSQPGNGDNGPLWR